MKLLMDAVPSAVFQRHHTGDGPGHQLFFQDLGEHVSQWTWNIVWQKGNAAAFSDKNIFKNIRYSKMIVVIVVVVKHQAKPTGKEAGGCMLGCSDSTREATATLSIGMLVITGAAHHRIV